MNNSKRRAQLRKSLSDVTKKLYNIARQTFRFVDFIYQHRDQFRWFFSKYREII